MGKSNILPSELHEAGHATTESAPVKQSFGDRLGDYFKSQHPIASGLVGVASGQPASQAFAPLASMPDGSASQPDYSQMIAQSAQPKQSGGGLSAILKLLGL